jgi:hypothetical protein
MYHFVKFNSTWYLKPECLQDVIDHFTKICGREFKQGFEDFRDNTRIRVSSVDGHRYLDSMNHSSSHWRNAVELEMKMKDKSWLDAATSLEERTYQDRIKTFLVGKPIYLTNGLAYYPPIEHPKYDEEKWSEELVYPFEYNYDEVRFLQWPDGKHWYAKIGNIDICDKYGNYKSRDKYYMMEVAKKFCECGGNWSKHKE